MFLEIIVYTKLLNIYRKYGLMIVISTVIGNIKLKACYNKINIQNIKHNIPSTCSPITV